MPKGQRPRGVIPRPRSGAVAESARLRWCRNGREELPGVQGRGARGGGREELPRVRRQGWQLEELPCVRGQGWRLGRATQCRRPGAAAGRTNPTPKEPLLRRQAQEGLEELSHVVGQKGQW